MFYGAAMGEDGSVVLAGSTEGSWDGERAGDVSDFAAVKLNADGEEVWRWQVWSMLAFHALYHRSSKGLLSTFAEADGVREVTNYPIYLERDVRFYFGVVCWVQPSPWHRVPGFMIMMR